jgi:hypothetical protein
MPTKQTKTIFVSFSVHNVYRNLFLFPNGFFDQLKTLLIRRPDLRFVFLLRARDREKYASLIESGPAGQSILEVVDIPSQKSTLQKLFRFFYAYLTYTNTTRILTTMGMRIDEPPGASNRSLSLIRSGIAFTFGKSIYFKKRLIPKLHETIFPERPFRQLFDTYQPDLVFATHIYGEYDTYLLREARFSGVRTVAMPSGWDHIDKYFLPIEADTLLVPSQQVLEHAVKFQSYDRDRIVITGYPHFDFLTSQEAFMPRKEVLSTCGFPPDSRYILYVSGSAYCPDEPDIIEKVANWIDDGSLSPDTHLVIRPYLGSRSKDKEFDQKKFARLTTRSKIYYYDTKSWDTIADSIFFANLMRHASVVMCVYSTVFLEASLYDRPLLAATFDGYHKRPYHRSIRRFADFEHFKDVLSLGAIKQVFDFPALKSALRAYLADDTLDAPAREMFRRETCYMLDGKASSRILDLIVKSVDIQ